MIKQFCNKTNAGSGTFEVLDRPLPDVRFRADKLALKIITTIKNTNVGSQTLPAEDFFENCKLSIFWRDGSKMIEQVPLRVLEWISQYERRGYVDGSSTLIECVDRTITAVSGASQDVELFIEINLAQPLFQNPTDFSQSLSQIGRIQFKPGDTGDADLTVTGVQILGVAEGEEIPYFHAGIRKFVSVVPSNVSKDQQLDIDGFLAILGMYSLDNSGNPIDADGPTVQVDGASQVEASDLSALELARFIGTDSPGNLTPARSGLTQTQWATLLGFGAGAVLGKLPKGNQVEVHFDAIAGSAQTQQFALLQFVQKTPKARRSFPGGASRTPAELDSNTVYRRLSAGDSITDRVAGYLPERVETPEAVGAPA